LSISHLVAIVEAKETILRLSQKNYFGDYCSYATMENQGAVEPRHDSTVVTHCGNGNNIRYEFNLNDCKSQDISSVICSR
jgi:hypothetical protein